MSYIVAILGIAALIVIHEAGHFLVARAFNMRVKKFSVGFFKPLVEWKPKGSETTYSIGSVPLGGYVQVDGLSPADDVDPDDRRSYANQPIYAKLAMVAAGPAANFISAALIFAVLFMVGIEVPDDAPVLGVANEGRPAHAAGLRSGDRILSIDGEQVDSWSTLAEQIHQSPGKALEIAYRRGAERRETTVTPELDEELGVGLIGIEPSTELVRRGPLEAVGAAFVYSAVATVSIAVVVVRLIMGRISCDAVSSPVGIVQIGVQQLEQGWKDYAGHVAQISLSLCLINFLPFPALDGGRVGFMLVELVSRKRVNRQVEGWAHGVGFILLLGLLIGFVVKDVSSCI